MRKTRKRCAPLLTCGLFCALLLSGCSSMMQSVADGTDAVLNGLAEGADQIAGALGGYDRCSPRRRGRRDG